MQNTFIAWSVFLSILLASPVVIVGRASAQQSGSIAIITSTVDSPYDLSIQQAFGDSASQLGYSWMSSAGRFVGDAEAQIAAVENYISQGVKAIAIDPNDAMAVAPALERAQAAGIVVITLNESWGASQTSIVPERSLIGSTVAEQLGVTATGGHFCLFDRSSGSAEGLQIISGIDLRANALRNDGISMPAGGVTCKMDFGRPLYEQATQLMVNDNTLSATVIVGSNGAEIIGRELINSFHISTAPDDLGALAASTLDNLLKGQAIGTEILSRIEVCSTIDNNCIEVANECSEDRCKNCACPNCCKK